MHLAPRLTPARMNCMARVVLPVPGSPSIRYIWPAGRPPERMSSRPLTPVSIRICRCCSMVPLLHNGGVAASFLLERRIVRGQEGVGIARDFQNLMRNQIFPVGETQTSDICGIGAN